MDGTLLAWTALAILVTLSPGPDFVVVTSNATRGGLRAGLGAMGGVVAGGAWYAALCGFGLLSILSAAPAVYNIVKTLGAIYLAWLGAQMVIGLWRNRGNANAGAASVEHRVGSPFRQGLLTSVLNPKVAVFYLAVLPQFVGAGPAAGAKGAALVAIHYSITAFWLGFVAFAASQSARALTRSNITNWLEGVFGVALIGMAGRLAFEKQN